MSSSLKSNRVGLRDLLSSTTTAIIDCHSWCSTIVSLGLRLRKLFADTNCLLTKDLRAPASHSLSQLRAAAYVAACNKLLRLRLQRSEQERRLGQNMEQRHREINLP